MPKLIVFHFENLDCALNLTFATLKKSTYFGFIKLKLDLI